MGAWFYLCCRSVKLARYLARCLAHICNKWDLLLLLRLLMGFSVPEGKPEA